jgi:hypothetical protein
MDTVVLPDDLCAAASIKCDIDTIVGIGVKNTIFAEFKQFSLKWENIGKMF